MERAWLFVVFLLLASEGKDETKQSELSTAFTETPATVSEGTERRDRTDTSFCSGTPEVGLNQSEPPTDGELQPNTTHLPLPKKDQMYYLWCYVVLCFFFAFACSFSLPCCPTLPEEEISCSSSSDEEQRTECDSISSMDSLPLSTVIDVHPGTSED